MKSVKVSDLHLEHPENSVFGTSATGTDKTDALPETAGFLYAVPRGQSPGTVKSGDRPRARRAERKKYRLSKL